MLKIKYLLSFVLIAAVVGVASAQSLPVGKYRLTSYDFKQKIAFPVDSIEVTLNVHKDGKLGGKSGCNVYGGSYSFEETRLKIADIISTQMYCDESTNQFEQLFDGTLTEATEFTLKDGVLTLTDPKTHTFLRFESAEKTKDKTHDEGDR